MRASSIAQNLGLGLAGGVAGVLAMNLLMKATKRLVREPDPLTPRDKRSMSLVGINHEPDESATQAVARITYRKLTGRRPSQRQKQALGTVIHWGYGLAMAGLYGALRARRLRRPDPLGGALFGAALWVIGDELLVPLLGLSDKPTQFPVSVHAHALAGHLAYGAATGAVTGALHARTI